MALEQGFVIGTSDTDGTADLNVSIGFLPSMIIITDVANGDVGIFFSGGTGNTYLDSAAASGANAFDETNEIAQYAGGDKLIYEGVTNDQWELDGDAGNDIVNRYVDEGGDIYPIRVIHKDPVDGAFVFTTPGFTIPGGNALNATDPISFIAFR